MLSGCSTISTCSVSETPLPLPFDGGGWAHQGRGGNLWAGSGGSATPWPGMGHLGAGRPHGPLGSGRPQGNHSGWTTPFLDCLEVEMSLFSLAKPSLRNMAREMRKKRRVAKDLVFMAYSTLSLYLRNKK
ncbi:hypothetical protein RHGRI_033311 [Rhododendron griersonianum]|uniref:Uncharacterized protein n=1 Tax=Rhododendron griersonianum TaxID=479676 RepID=A0AAV6HW77_9ERIC|nr:hypothetical protein RHGRI_033311 [Rhododendron griersonianum]